MSQTVIVVPCFNEAGRLPVGPFRSFAARDDSCRFLLVDDGSTDATPKTLAGLRAAYPKRFGILRLPRNMGKAEAVRQGVLLALAGEPEFVGYWNADLATPLDAVTEFRRILDDRPELEIAMGARVGPGLWEVSDQAVEDGHQRAASGGPG